MVSGTTVFGKVRGLAEDVMVDAGLGWAIRFGWLGTWLRVFTGWDSWLGTCL